MSEPIPQPLIREQELIEAVNAIMGGYPEVAVLVDGFNCTMFRVRDKSFVRIFETELCFKATPETQAYLIQQEGYWKTSYFGQYGWVSTRADLPGCWEELQPLLKEAYCLSAPKRLAKQALQA